MCATPITALRESFRAAAPDDILRAHETRDTSRDRITKI